MIRPEQDQLNIWDLEIGDWVHKSAPDEVCWGKIVQLDLDRNGATKRVLLSWYTQDPRLVEPRPDYIHRDRADDALNVIDALLRPARLPITRMNVLAVLNVLPQHPAPMPVNPVMLIASGFAIVYYNVQ
jgi:hypothetical protein